MAKDRLRAALRHAQSVGDTEMVDVIEAALHRRRQRQAREVATRPRHGRVPSSIGDELTELLVTVNRPEAIKILAARYHVTPDAIRKKLRN